MNKDDSTRKKILVTAADIFASYGIEGARMDQIAKQADVNKATIYYNIGNKQALYEEVLNETFTTGFHNFIKTIEHENLNFFNRHCTCNHIFGSLFCC